MRAARPLPALALLAALALAGCLAPATAPEPLAPSAAAPAAAVPSFAMSATQCEAAGFVAAYNFDYYDGETPTHAEVWVLADVRDEIGNPVHDAMGMPTTGPMFSHWHMGFRCASAASGAGEAADFLWGFIGTMVEPPPWDRGGAELHFLLSGLGFQDGPLREALMATTTADITPAVEARVDWYLPRELPRSAAYVRYVDQEKGVYEGWGDLAFLRDVPERTLRFWWQVPVDGSKDDHAHHNGQNSLFGEPDEDAVGEWHPVSWDLHVAGGPQYTTPPADGVQLGSHNMLKFEHGPIPGQPALTNIYELESLTFTSGRVVDDVVLTRMWNH